MLQPASGLVALRYEWGQEDQLAFGSVAVVLAVVLTVVLAVVLAVVPAVVMAVVLSAVLPEVRRMVAMAPLQLSSEYQYQQAERYSVGQEQRLDCFVAPASLQRLVVHWRSGRKFCGFPSSRRICLGPLGDEPPLAVTGNSEGAFSHDLILVVVQDPEWEEVSVPLAHPYETSHLLASAWELAVVVRLATRLVAVFAAMEAFAVVAQSEKQLVDVFAAMEVFAVVVQSEKQLVDVFAATKVFAVSVLLERSEAHCQYYCWEGATATTRQEKDLEQSQERFECFLLLPPILLD